MSIRLNKVTKDLNVGLSTVVKFLQSKGFSPEENPNAKISDEEYVLLVAEYSEDKDLKSKSKEIHPKVKKESVAAEGYSARKAPEEIKTVVPEEAKAKFKIVDKMDLKAAGKPQSKPKPKSQPKPVVAKEIVEEETPVVEKTAVIEEEIEKNIPAIDSVEAVNEEDTRIEGYDNDSADDDGEATEDAAAEADATPVQPFRYSKTPTLTGPRIIDTIDLSQVNLSTRPKKKSKEEKKKERAAKEKQAAAGKTAATTGADAHANLSLVPKGAAGDKKKKRKRIDKERIDIEKGVPVGQQKDSGNNLKLRKSGAKSEVSEEDVQKQVKETLARLTNKTQKKGAKYRKEKRENASQRQSEQDEIDALEGSVIKITEFVTANDLASMMNVSVTQIISTCMSIGIMVSINQRLDAETINIVADEFGFKTEYVSAEVAEAITEVEDKPEDLKTRAPIVTVMGHVDHGKTSLLDNIRKTNVIAGEAGGITQHIGAYNVKLPGGQRITFLDTPGHEAFTAMRARGASVTDIAIIIVAADDNVMPQTVEAINHAAAANVPIIFAINKIDKPGANPEKIKEALSQMNYLVEDWGGKYQSQDISAKQGLGVEELLEKVLLEADLLELKANPKRRAIGSIIESSLDKGRGYMVTMLVQNGTLKVGDVVLAGTHYGRVKAMFNERNQRIMEAGPAEPVLILGLDGAPQAGDTINVMETEQEAREIATKREQLQREQGLRTQKRITLSDIGRRLAIGNFQEINVIVKGDVDGSVEALSDSLIRLSTEQIQVNVIHKGVGQISESDVILSAASDAIIIGFQVRPSQSARKLADKEGVDVRLYSIIYDAIEEVKSAMEGMLAPEMKEEIIGNVEVLDVFKITKVGTVAGCMVREFSAPLPIFTKPR
ncbi:hypothetical protein FACS1894162_6570 [Bacteroidia bacterium]|nr:hypothetical protein FACS1894162_6570 [Bacteroidia bacterium]